MKIETKTSYRLLDTPKWIVEGVAFVEYSSIVINIMESVDGSISSKEMIIKLPTKDAEQLVTRMSESRHPDTLSSTSTRLNAKIASEWAQNIVENQCSPRQIIAANGEVTSVFSLVKPASWIMKGEQGVLDQWHKDTYLIAEWAKSLQDTIFHMNDGNIMSFDEKSMEISFQKPVYCNNAE